MAAVGERNVSVLDRIVRFLGEIGLDCRQGEVPAETLLPGLSIDGAVLRYDPDHLRQPGDLLHEAGHLAILTPARRRELEGAFTATPSEEMAAIAWSYAAAVHLDIDPRVVFHAEGYAGGSEALLQSFTQPQPIGTPLLAWFGMTALPGIEDHDCPRYPGMRCWLREDPTLEDCS